MVVQTSTYRIVTVTFSQHKQHHTTHNTHNTHTQTNKQTNNTQHTTGTHHPDRRGRGLALTDAASAEHNEFTIVITTLTHLRLEFAWLGTASFLSKIVCVQKTHLIFLSSGICHLRRCVESRKSLKTENFHHTL
jgi:hypothetical protein